MIKRLFSFRHPLNKMEKKRLKQIEQGKVPKVLQPLYQQSVPGPETPIEQLKFLVVDFETSGLDPEHDAILSIGMVEIHQQTLSLSSASHVYVARPQAVKPETAIINHIVPETLEGGMSLKQSMQSLIWRMQGKILVAHGAGIEHAFLCHALGIHELALPIVWLDTLMLERSLAVNRGKATKDYRLCKIRKGKGLPDYVAHNALADSVATGELLLVLIKDIFSHATPTLGPLYQRSLRGYT